MARMMGRPKKDLSEQHGTPQGYNKGCRCDLCTAANTAAKRKSRQSKAEWGKAHPDKIPHGTTGHDEYGCRCDTCRFAHSARMGRRDRRTK